MPTRLGKWISCSPGSSTSNMSPLIFSVSWNTERAQWGERKTYVNKVSEETSAPPSAGSLTFTSVPFWRGFSISRFSSPQLPPVFELHTTIAPSASSWKRGLKCSARSSEPWPRSIWNLSSDDNRSPTFVLSFHTEAMRNTKPHVNLSYSTTVSLWLLLYAGSYIYLFWLRGWCLVSLPLSIMQNYSLYFQLISSSQFHILQFEFLGNRVM